MAKYDNYIKTSYYYSAGSEAYDISPLRRRIIEEERERQQALEEAKAEKARRRAVFRHSVKFMAAIAMVFMGCIAIMVPHAMIAEQTRKNNALRDELAVLKSENISLEADIANKVNLEYVETEAQTRLGMSEPQAYQIGYIDVPRHSYSVQYDVEDDVKTNEGFAFAGLGGLFTKD